MRKLIVQEHQIITLDILPILEVSNLDKSTGFDITNLRGRQFGVEDFDNFDLIYVMDNSNYKNVLSLARGEDDKAKVELLLNVSNPDQFLEVPDPYFGGEQGFENVYHMIDEACAQIAKNVQNG